MIYRIETSGDGKGVQTIDGEWSDLVKAVAEIMFEPVTSDDLIEVHEMLKDEWDGRRAYFNFEDGDLEVTASPTLTGKA